MGGLFFTSEGYGTNLRKHPTGSSEHNSKHPTTSSKSFNQLKTQLTQSFKHSALCSLDGVGGGPCELPPGEFLHLSRLDEGCLVLRIVVVPNKERFFIELMASDRRLKASREGSKRRSTRPKGLALSGLRFGVWGSGSGVGSAGLGV